MTWRQALAMLGDLVMLAAMLWLGYACLNSLMTTEIGFGRSTRIIRLANDPGWFWFAFWFQFFLAIGGVFACIHSIRKRAAAIRAARQGHGQPARSKP
jgi:TRAP-type C4-dicarboxylate transport system permease small subunit